MTKSEAIAHFGSASKLASALDIEKSAVSQWGEFPPRGRQFEIQSLTKGKLKAEPVKSKAAA